MLKLFKFLTYYFKKIIQIIKKKLKVVSTKPCNHYNRTSWRIKKISSSESYFYFYCNDCEKVITKK